ncbi:hypothetical protein TESG_07082 [Trichophyton tonsurans CBS 112818]|uniref:Uncharacterized protein n=1 Tax=Trichophyton tonsurans (strain CBS 112818) TaxID=647933 RepID=F2S844_TRIT1|nr:hypothetical protein TESG_07082 [Trichophyton tonsurans CBS 112818]
MDQIDCTTHSNSTDEVHTFDMGNARTFLDLSQEEIDLLLNEWNRQDMDDIELPPLEVSDSAQLPVSSDLLNLIAQDEFPTEANPHGVPDLISDKGAEKPLEELSLIVKELQESVQQLREDKLNGLTSYIEKLQPFLSYVGDAVTKWVGLG